jgi:glycosyltransferase involved in cell wall biosynthesis
LTESREDVFSRLGLDPDRLLFIVVAVLERRKGHRVLLQALAEMLGTPMEFHIPQIIIEGDGSCWQELVTFVKRNNLQSYVRFIGPEKNVFNLLNASDALVLPSRSHEDFPNVILEAMALGKPVIATRLAVIPEQVEQLVTGLIVEPGDARALGEAIVSLSRDSTLRKEMGKAARERFDREFVAAVAVRRYQELYSILTAKGPR